MQGAHADAQGILFSFYSSAAGFVNGKCACFLPGFLGRAQKSGVEWRENPFRLLTAFAATFPKGTALVVAGNFSAAPKGVPLRADFPRSGGRCRAATKGGICRTQ